MKIQKLLLHEVLETGFDINKISPSVWSIDVPPGAIEPNSVHGGTELKIRVDVRTDTVDGYRIIEVSFGVPGTQKTKLENIFEKTGVFKLLKSIIDIVETYGADIILFIPNDTEVDIGEKKARIYRTVAHRMRQIGLVGRIEEFEDSGHTFQVVFPTASRAWQLPNTEVENLLIQFAGNKASPP